MWSDKFQKKIIWYVRTKYGIYPALARLYRSTKRKIRIYRRATGTFVDLLNVLRFMRWDKHKTSYWRLSSELVFQYHKIEKGLCIGGTRRFFGADAADETLKLLEEWKACGFSCKDPLYIGCMEALQAYLQRLNVTPPSISTHPNLRKKILSALEGYIPVPINSTPLFHSISNSTSLQSMRALAIERRSVRWFEKRPVGRDILIEAIKIAQLAPSACNRQPWRVHAYEGRDAIDSMLSLQNGNSGFGHRIPLLLIICADARSFFDGTERHEPYLDSGLFLMTLILALQASGLASCCLNWCVESGVDRKGHRIGNIPDNEVIITYLAVGYSTEGALVARSPRRDVNSVIEFH